MAQSNRTGKVPAYRDALASRMLGESQDLDLRDYLAFHRMGLIGGDLRDIAREASRVLHTIRGDKSELERLAFPFLRLDEASATSQELSLLSDLLAAPAASDRAFALAELQRQSFGQDRITRASREALAKLTPRLQKSRLDVQAAEQAIDVLRDDWLYHLAGLRTSWKMRFGKGISDYLADILWPSREMLARLGPIVVGAGRSGSDALAAVTRQLADTPHLADALDRYMEQFGHVPFGQKWSLSTLMQGWKNIHPDTAIDYLVLHKWGRERGTPAGLAHVCQWVTKDVSLVQDAEHRRLFWDDVADLFDLSDRREDGGFRAAVLLYELLAAHFTRVVECMFPGATSDGIYVLAWWLATRVSEVFQGDPSGARWAIEKAVRPALAQSGWTWSAVRPVAQCSRSRFASLLQHSWWRNQLVVGIDSCVGALKPAAAGELSAERLRSAYLKWMVQTPMVPDEPEAELMLGIASLPTATVDAFAQAWPDCGPGLKEMLALAEATTAAGELLSIIVAPTATDEETKQTQVLYSALRLQQLLYCGMVPPEVVWDIAATEKWWNQVLQGSSADALEVIYDCLAEAQMRRPAKWRGELPSLFALLLEQKAGGGKHQPVLFGLVVLSSLGADGSGAVDRLLKGSRRGEYSNYVEHWRALLNGMRTSSAPQWVQGRARAMLCAMHIG